MNRRAFFTYAVGAAAGAGLGMAGSSMVERRAVNPDAAGSSPAPSASPDAAAALPCGEQFDERHWWPAPKVSPQEWALVSARRELAMVDKTLRDAVLFQHDTSLTRYIYNPQTGEVVELERETSQPAEIQRVITELTAHRNRLMSEIVEHLRRPMIGGWA